MSVSRLIADHMAMPMTHRVVTHYADGSTYVHRVRSASAAENWAIGERRKVGRHLIDRETGRTVQVTRVTISAI